MTKRNMYRQSRYTAFIGVQVTAEMNETLEREADRALRPKSEFIRYVLEEGLKSWRFREMRAVKEQA